MRRRIRFSVLLPSTTAIVLLLLSRFGHGEAHAQEVEWRHYGADRSHSRYLPLDQVNKSNVTKLKEVWRWESVDEPIAAKNRRLGAGAFKPTPLMVGGVLYVSTSFSQVAAIDPASGKTLWVHDPESYKRPRPGNSGYQHRGVEYWTDGKDERIIIATGGRQLVAVNAKTGKTYPGFGKRGWVDLRQGLAGEHGARLFRR